MATVDEEIDALYRLSPEAFTAARNDLAKRAGSHGAEIRRLAKPNAPAWAVNQLYWRRRPVFDALVKASEARRTAHVRQLGGQAADLALADARHRAALDAALDAATAFLKETGDAVSPATVDALTRTLEAVPAPEIDGRLTRPLEPTGFSALASLLTGKGSVAARPPADVVVMKRRERMTADESRAAREPTRRDREREKKAAEEAKRAAEARKRARERLKKEVAAAQVKERDAANALAKARQAAERAGSRADQLEEELDQARKDLSDRHEEAERARVAVNKTAAARVTLERQLQEIEE